MSVCIVFGREGRLMCVDPSIGCAVNLNDQISGESCENVNVKLKKVKCCDRLLVCRISKCF